MAELPDAPTCQDDPEQQALAGELAQRLGASCASSPPASARC